jgi:hypothetical protein
MAKNKPIVKLEELKEEFANILLYSKKKEKDKNGDFCIDLRFFDNFETVWKWIITNFIPKPKDCNCTFSSLKARGWPVTNHSLDCPKYKGSDRGGDHW